MSCAALRVINSATEKIEPKNVVRTVFTSKANKYTALGKNVSGW